MKIGGMRDVRHPAKSTSSAQKGAGEAGKRGEVDDEGDKAQNKSPLKQGVKEGGGIRGKANTSACYLRWSQVRAANYHSVAPR